MLGAWERLWACRHGLMMMMWWTTMQSFSVVVSQCIFVVVWDDLRFIDFYFTYISPFGLARSWDWILARNFSTLLFKNRSSARPSEVYDIFQFGLGSVHSGSIQFPTSERIGTGYDFSHHIDMSTLARSTNWKDQPHFECPEGTPPSLKTLKKTRTSKN